ncbi:MAG: phosphatase PAP2 family protein [Xanthomonadaceae bacterium]|nr:phosphatase PAP2 family protein [Xanthomonadaceae bacterium]
MVSAVEWIGGHAVMLWLSLILAGVLGADLAWQRWRHGLDEGRPPPALRRHAAKWLMLCALMLFAGLVIAVRVTRTGWLPHFDMALAQSLHDHVPRPALHLIASLTCLGGVGVVAPAAILVLLGLLRRRQWWPGMAWALALGGVMPINGGLKQLFRRVRPLHGHGFVTEPGWSFPSGHAFGAVVFYGMLAYLLLRLLPPRFHRGAIATAAVMIGMLGGSRVLLQVHYFSDVLAGYAAGAAWLLLCIGVAEHGRTDARHMPPAATSRLSP